jgi:maltooligosyltrehalose trehalohydrolase
VASGRADFLAQFPAIAGMREHLAKPHDVATFERCKLDHEERHQHVEMVALYRDLLRLRRDDPVIAIAHRVDLDGAVITDQAFVVRYFGELEERLLIFNFGVALPMGSVAEPLVAAPHGARWELLWSSEDPAYGGDGVASIDEGGWHVAARCATVLRSVPT